MGGALSFLGAEYAGLDAAAPFYGTPPAELGHVRSAARLTILADAPLLSVCAWLFSPQYGRLCCILLHGTSTTLHASHNSVHMQPEKIKIPVQAHVGQDDAFEVRCCSPSVILSGCQGLQRHH